MPSSLVATVALLEAELALVALETELVFVAMEAELVLVPVETELALVTEGDALLELLLGVVLDEFFDEEFPVAVEVGLDEGGVVFVRGEREAGVGGGGLEEGGGVLGLGGLWSWGDFSGRGGWGPGGSG